MSNQATKLIKIFDTTLRDGEQSPGFAMNITQKIQFAKQLDKLQVDVIEAGFPVASQGDFDSVEAIAKIVEFSEVCGLCRTVPNDIEVCWNAVKLAKKPRIHTFISTSSLHMVHKLKKTPDEVVEMARSSVALAKSLCERVTFSAEDAGRSDKDFLVRVFEVAIEAGADTINIPDTVGYMLPDEYGRLVKYIIENTKGGAGVTFATHCHDDLGLAVANSIAGVQNGCTEIQCAVNGIGERAGNASLEEVVMIVKTRPDLFPDCTMSIETKELFPASEMLSDITKIFPQPNKAIVGRNAFAHASGVHQDGLLKNEINYQILTPESVGVSSNKIVLTKHSGRNALKSRLITKGIELNDEQMIELYNKFKAFADTRTIVSDEELFAMV
jgi:2-isopropylmalate synthase